MAPQECDNLLLEGHEPSAPAAPARAEVGRLFRWAAGTSASLALVGLLAVAAFGSGTSAASRTAASSGVQQSDFLVAAAVPKEQPAPQPDVPLHPAPPAHVTPAPKPQPHLPPHPPPPAHVTPAPKPQPHVPPHPPPPAHVALAPKATPKAQPHPAAPAAKAVEVHKDPEEECGLTEGAGCLKSRCCKGAGLQCYTKNEYWAQCMVECSPGPNPLDQQSSVAWECKKLGDRAPGEPKTCSAAHEDCTHSGCCKQGGTQCFRKNETWAECKASCSPGPDLTASDWLPWSCAPIGPKTNGAAPWVATKCANNIENCETKQCCATAGMRCYKKDAFWSQCKETCTPGETPMPGDDPWSCDPVGTRTPDFVKDAAAEKGRVAPWVAERCSTFGEDCSESQCCKEVDAQCFSKNQYWASCKTSCSHAPDPLDHNSTWDCVPKGPKGWGLAVKGYPSLFCCSLYMPTSYERGLMVTQLKLDAGIFTCDGFDVFAAEDDTLGTTKDGIVVKPVLIPKITVGKSQDGTAGNAKLFMAVWDKIIAAGRFRNYDFTLKVDPDAVLLAWRVRQHMKAHIGANAYVVNCNKFPGSPNFPMMYGAVEIFTKVAMLAYAKGSGKCGTQLPWGAWGEDYYMTHCLDSLGVGRILDFTVVGDAVCTGANCMDANVASFHPFKTTATWMQCWSQATIPPTTPHPAVPAPA